ncbi:MAG: hypothetical protein FWH36_01135 [Lentimicrobiaceae bacterium]|nr:hypothetical protein [Lentimicrobiaceae bacterium]
MNWKTKAFIQNFVAYLPQKISYEAYFQMQRYFGGFKKPFNPLNKFEKSVDVLKKILNYGYTIDGKIFLEVGTGHAPIFPIAFWLCGAEKTVTIDLNPYIRNELIMDMLFFVKTESLKIETVFGNLLNQERFNLLLDYSRRNKIDKNNFLKLCRIEYIAPGDAAKTNLPKNSINYHISNTVYEHIPLNIVHNILEEGNRIISKEGLFINNIDYSDHFAHMDKNIPAINFLQFDDKTWEKYAGNRYMYMNRARHDDFVELFTNVGHDFLEIKPCKNEEVLNILENNKITLDNKFRNKSNEILSITGASFITQKKE